MPIEIYNGNKCCLLRRTIALHTYIYNPDNGVMFCITTPGLICQVHALLMYRPFLKVYVHANTYLLIRKERNIRHELADS